MPNASRKLCDFPNCNYGPPAEDESPTPYVTPADLRTREEVSADLDRHILMAHTLPLQQEQARAQILQAEAAKINAEANKIREERGPPAQDSSSISEVPLTAASSRKSEKLSRPTIDEDITESYW